MIYICKPTKVRIYVNTARKSAADIMEETGCTAIINGGLYNMGSFQPLCHLKVEGKIQAQDQYKYWGYGWSGDDLPAITNDYTKQENYICCVCMVREGKAEKMYYDSNVGRSTYRTAIGTFADGRLWLYADKSGKTPVQLQALALEAGVRDAVMLDGGGSTQCIFPDGEVTSSRRVQNLICVWTDEAAKTQGDDSMFKIALSAGHGINTSGKRCLKSLDPNETREWWLNDRICDYVEAGLKDYTGYELLRMDDSDDGEDNVALATRVAKANNFGADFYLSIHHNAGVNGGSGGGIVAYTCKGAGTNTKAWQKDLYDALIAKTGLRGNRSTPLAEYNYYVLVNTKMPAVLLELGFMDSKADVPVILTDDYAKKCAAAIVEVLVKRGGLVKKPAETKKPATTIQVDPAKSFSSLYAKTYTVTASSGLKLRRGAGTTKGVIKTMPKGEKVTCYGYYTKVVATIWLYVKLSDGTVGYCSKRYLQ